MTLPIVPADSPVLEPAEQLALSLHERITREPFFQGLTPGQIQRLADCAMEMNFAAGQSIFDAGSPANRFYLILEGRVALECEGAEQRQILVQTLGPGEDLGWSWLFPPYYLHFSAHAVEATRTIFFYGTRLREQCEQDHELGFQLMKRVAEVAVKSLQATQMRLLDCLPRGGLPPPD